VVLVPQNGQLIEIEKGKIVIYIILLVTLSGYPLTN
jgi:hypothetical protein